MQHHIPKRPDSKNMMTALAMCAALIIGWQYFVEIPKRAKLAEWQRTQMAEKEKVAKALSEKQAKLDEQPASSTLQDGKPSPRVAISSDTLHGTIALKGLRFDELTLAKYKETLDAESEPVHLLFPSSAETPYFMQVGWLSDDANLRLPNEQSLWQTKDTELTPTKPLALEWKNGEGVTFHVNIRLDENYMFAIEQSVTNASGETLSVSPYALINRGYKETGIHGAILHEGPLGVLNNTLKEIAYKDLHDKKDSTANTTGWIGFTDKYWLTALIPDQNKPFTANFIYYNSKNVDRYQSDYVGEKATIADGETNTTTLHFFAGAKEIDVLDRYTAGVKEQNLAPVPLFDRAVDFGWLYFITKPIFLTLNFFYKLVGNFGIAILILTVIIKALMFPLANKGYKSMTQMKALQPEMKRIQERYHDDRLKQQQELLALYKKEKVNPASGCLPILIQMPIFFALYKVLFVTIEMRHAPFFAPWVDLSAMDPTNIFNAFGLIPWNPPEILMLGILPILMTVTMIIQMRQQPTPTDPVQAKVMKIMPWFILFVTHRMPAGLVLYWVWSNILSILQQHIITRRYQSNQNKKKQAV
jgi:YidC/Oxa1 family membrane protein insertase